MNVTFGVTEERFWMHTFVSFANKAALRSTSFPPQEDRSTTQPAINATLPRFLSGDMLSSAFLNLGP